MSPRTLFWFSAALALSGTAYAHDFSHDLARFNQLLATKRSDSKEVVQAKLALERAQGQMEHADGKLLLRIRSLTNSGLQELGEQPAFLSSEQKRLEAAIASPKVNDPTKLAKARQILTTVALERQVYDALEHDAVDQMKQALKLVEAAPSK